jgi:hypothetical protein
MSLRIDMIPTQLLLHFEGLQKQNGNMVRRKKNTSMGQSIVMSLLVAYSIPFWMAVRQVLYPIDWLV